MSKEEIIEKFKMTLLKDIKNTIGELDGDDFHDDDLEWIIDSNKDWIFSGEDVDLSLAEVKFIEDDISDDFISKEDIEDYLEMKVEDYFKLKKLERRYKSSFQANK